MQAASSTELHCRQPQPHRRTVPIACGGFGRPPAKWPAPVHSPLGVHACRGRCAPAPAQASLRTSLGSKPLPRSAASLMSNCQLKTGSTVWCTMGVRNTSRPKRSSTKGSQSDLLLPLVDVWLPPAAPPWPALLLAAVGCCAPLLVGRRLRPPRTHTRRHPPGPPTCTNTTHSVPGRGHGAGSTFGLCHMAAQQHPRSQSLAAVDAAPLHVLQQ